jgi:hypothetical protein
MGRPPRRAKLAAGTPEIDIVRFDGLGAAEIYRFTAVFDMLVLSMGQAPGVWYLGDSNYHQPRPIYCYA